MAEAHVFYGCVDIGEKGGKGFIAESTDKIGGVEMPPRQENSLSGP